MNRRSKIIVSVVGIFIVLLALVGITYAYFLTQVQGNTNDTSISITTANLRLVYRDGSPNIEATNIQPSKTEFYTKQFTVTNEGNASIDYEVYLENVINNFIHEEDLLMFVTCTSNIVGNTCNGYGNGTVTDNTPTFGDSIYPQTNIKLISNSIEPASTGVNAEVHTYTLYLKFKDDNSDQSIDMGKTLQGKIQIYDPKDVVAITGTVTGYDSSYYLELHSDTKTSEIASDGSYVFYGVEPDNHTLYVMKRTESGSEEVVNKTITVTKGSSATVNSDASNIVIDDNTLGVEVDIKLTKSGETTSITTTAGDIEKILYLKDAILTDNTPYADNVRSTYVNSDTGINFNQPSSDTNGKGLYYTSTNTEGNKPTYYFRGDVTNNYVVFGKESDGKCWFKFQTFSVDGEYDSITSATSIPSLTNENSCTSALIYGIYSREAGSGEDGWGISIESINSFSTEEECTSFHNYEYGGDREYKCVLYEEKPVWIVDNFIWRIMRINEDGSVRMILEGDIGTSELTFDETNIKLSPEYGAGKLLNDWYKTNLISYSNKLFDSGFCEYDSREPIGESDYMFTYNHVGFGCASRLYKDSGNFDGPIGMITSEEVKYAGYTYRYNAVQTGETYLTNGVQGKKTFWTMSPSYITPGPHAFNMSTYGTMDEIPEFSGYINSENIVSMVNLPIRPVINLNSNVEYELNGTGNPGTSTNPYIIKVDE